MKAIVFDLDDTLVQSRKALNAAVGATLTAFGARVNSSAFVAILRRAIRNLGDDLNAGRVSVQDLADALVTAFTAELRLDRESARVLCENFFNKVMELVEAYDDLPAALGRLRGSYTLGIATNGPGLVQREKLRRTGLIEIFDFVLCSSDIGICKPDTAFYDHVRHLAGTRAEQILVVGNNVERDLIPAMNAGMRAAWIDRSDYGPQTVP